VAAANVINPRFRQRLAPESDLAAADALKAAAMAAHRRRREPICCGVLAKKTSVRIQTQIATMTPTTTAQPRSPCTDCSDPERREHHAADAGAVIAIARAAAVSE